MSRQFLILILTIEAFVTNCYSQNLLTVDWQKVVCAGRYIDQTYSICNDNNGNTYTLGSFANFASCLGDSVNENSGSYFLTKQDSNGDKLFAKNLGGTDNFSFGDIKVCSNGDIVLGLCFKTTFFLNGDSITSSADWRSIILKLDQNLTLKWFKTFPAKNATYINQLVLDSDENIYASILFIDSLSINGNIYTQKLGYGTAIAKLDSAGDILWAHHYYSDYGLWNQVLKIQANRKNCPKTIFISGSIGGDSILIDGALKAHHQSKFNTQFFVATLNENGNILQTKFIDDGIRNIADINFYQGRIYIAGNYIDTINWTSTYITPYNYSSIYLGELSEQADLIGFADLNSNQSTYLVGFKISPQYGFLLWGSFEYSFSLLSSSIKLPGQYNIGSFITSINDSLKLNDCKYISGGRYGLSFLSIFNNQINGTAGFEMLCNFQNQSCFAWNVDISTFQTTDVNQMVAFDPIPFPIPEVPIPPPIPIPCSVQVYPNPFGTSFELKFSEPINSTSLRVTNTIGQVCKDILVSQINDTEVRIDASALSPGIYIVQYLTCNNEKATFKLIKVDE